MKNDVAIRMTNGWKRYGTSLSTEFKRIVHRFHNGNQPFDLDNTGEWKLSDVSFEVKRGEILGVIGKNGAGKSTLLKVLANVSPLTKGTCEMNGRVFPMIELNAGMHPDLSGRQNVFMIGAVMGFTQDEIAYRMPEIEEFCELGVYFDRSVWTYSSGMLARLGFAVAVNVSADILLVDEVLAVGDISFQRKCFERIESLYRSGVSLVFVSHSLRMVERLCTQTLYMKNGYVAAYGNTADVITEYELDNSEKLLASAKQEDAKLSRQADVLDQSNRNPDHIITVKSVQLLDASGQPSNIFFTGSSLTIRVNYFSKEDVTEPIVGFGISRESVYITGFTNELVNQGITFTKGEGVFECRIDALALLGGVYNLSIKFRNQNGAMLGGSQALIYFSVQTPAEIRRANQYGYILTEATWNV